MLKLGNLIPTDVYLMDIEKDQNLEKWAELYDFHLINQSFQSFKIGIPSYYQDYFTEFVTKFISNHFIKGEIFYFCKLTAGVTLKEFIANCPYITDQKQIHLLPDEHISYRKIGPDFWDLSVQGYEFIFYHAERIDEGRKDFSIYSRYHKKGALLGFCNDPKFKMGFFHNSRLKRLIELQLANFWITSNIDNKHKSYYEICNNTVKLLMKK